VCCVVCCAANVAGALPEAGTPHNPVLLEIVPCVHPGAFACFAAPGAETVGTQSNWSRWQESPADVSKSFPPGFLAGLAAGSSPAMCGGRFLPLDRHTPPPLGGPVGRRGLREAENCDLDVMGPDTTKLRGSVDNCHE
jgi:hypothetical protein